jgi:hypothetical protein
MPILILILLSLIVIYGPQFWAKKVLSRYNKNQYFSGSGIELARTMLERLNMPHVRVEAIEQGDHYDPKEKVLRLSRNNCGGRSLTAVVVATHEVGHAIQDNTGYLPLQVRTRMIRAAQKAEKLGAVLMISIPLIAIITRVPAAGALMFLGGLASLGLPVVIHLLTLPVEWDASFKRALPILSTGEYIPAEDLPAAQRILLACALTYVAGALASLLNIWRWIRILRR